MFVDNSNAANFLGYLSYKFVPTIADFSAPIVNDMASYDFTDASIFYYRNYIYIAIPKNGIVREYNMTDQGSQQFSGGKALEDVTQQPWFWEAPITYPISGFYTVNGELYGHSYTTSESYKLFTGGTFNGQQIDANATFAFNDEGGRTQTKTSSGIWVEGYIKQNTILSCDIAGDLDSFRVTQTAEINGNDNTIVAFGGGGNSLGDSSLGVQTIGGSANTVGANSLPAWFHVIKTYPPQPFFQEQITFRTKGLDLQWELLAYGTNAAFTNEDSNSITP